MQKPSRTKQIRLILFSLILCLAGLLVFFTKKGVFLSENQAFDRFTDQLFREEMSGNTLSLHYTLAYPEKYGIKDTPVSLGRVSPEAFKNDYITLENTLAVLSDFDYNKLSEKNQLTFDILKLSIQTRLSLKDNYMLLEPLSPNLGIQAQLPVLLAEYTFRTSDDIRNYLSLLASIPDYFEEILKFEQEKSRQGLFMNDRFVERVSEQCSRFADSSSDYLTDMFTEKMGNFLESKKITRTQYDRFLKLHKKIMNEKVFPAYRNLQEGLTALKGTGKNENGLVHLPGGLSYYQYLVPNDTGYYRSLP